ncbi:zinc-ribbon domain-containing protein [Pseudomonas mucidolens]|uniref:zinc-ribbon domain-containing protein n=1 Tax=Pseudomonas mucidolens TaxID=46679 RepID=UPI000B183A63|nr:zinc-ribbon domain-containing protein [Pseudomonas mucidolens]
MSGIAVYRFFEQLSSRLGAPSGPARNGKVWACRCGQSLFFRNSQCLACSALLGSPERQQPLAGAFPSSVR